MANRYNDSRGERYRLALDGAAIDGDVSEVCKELLSAVLCLHKFKQLGRIVDELRWVSATGQHVIHTSAHGCPGLPGNEDIMRQQTEEERNVCL
jgi:hypothetical protein